MFAAHMVLGLRGNGEHTPLWEAFSSKTALKRGIGRVRTSRVVCHEIRPQLKAMSKASTALGIVIVTGQQARWETIPVGSKNESVPAVGRDVFQGHVDRIVECGSLASRLVSGPQRTEPRPPTVRIVKRVFPKLPALQTRTDGFGASSPSSVDQSCRQD